MSIISCTLAPEGVARIYDALLCLSKFSDTVGFEVQHNRLTLTALNTSKSAFASFSLLKDVFFQTFSTRSDDTVDHSPKDGKAHFTCRLYNKALLPVFKGRISDTRDRDTSIERCEINIQDRPDKTECRLIVKMNCSHGVTKTYKLTYESAKVQHAVFPKEGAKNHWSIGAHVLKSFGEYFGAKAEQLDIYYETGRTTFTSYTEKVMNGNDILKQPLQTSITIDSLDFEDFSVQEKLHIGITVKDFKAIVTHAETLKTTIIVRYAFPSQPMKLSYNEHGVQCEFVLMTIGDYRGGSVTPAPYAIRNMSTRPSTRPEPTRPQPTKASKETSAGMLPPLQPASRSFVRADASQQQSKPSPSAPQASVDHESLFIPQDEDETLWGEPNYDDEQEDQLGWGAGENNNLYTTALHRSSISRHVPANAHVSNANSDHERRVPPTQQISQISSWPV